MASRNEESPRPSVTSTRVCLQHSLSTSDEPHFQSESEDQLCGLHPCRVLEEKNLMAIGEGKNICQPRLLDVTAPSAKPVQGSEVHTNRQLQSGRILELREIRH